VRLKRLLAGPRSAVVAGFRRTLVRLKPVVEARGAGVAVVSDELS